MKVRPHYLLFSKSRESPLPGQWRFVVRWPDGSIRLEARDVEPGVVGERLELLTIVRGLEALDQPSRVTLLTPSSYVCEGIRYGVAEWRKNGWCWEWFGQMVPVKHGDLWRRVDRALRFHHVECRRWRVDPAHEPCTQAAKPMRSAIAARHASATRQSQPGGHAPWRLALDFGKLFQLRRVFGQ